MGGCKPEKSPKHMAAVASALCSCIPNNQSFQKRMMKMLKVTFCTTMPD